jgi:hypothetical protein
LFDLFVCKIKNTLPFIVALVLPKIGYESERSDVAVKLEIGF